MNKFKLISIVAILFIGNNVFAQDLDQAIKAINAEQFEKAKTILKKLTVEEPHIGKNFFVLGNLYLTEKFPDSAVTTFQRGLVADVGAHYNYIGLGQIDLENGNEVAATANFAKATEKMGKKDFEEYLYIGRAYMNPVLPNYTKALENINKAKEFKPMDARIFLTLGDAYYGAKKVNEAYSAYRNSYDVDNSMLRAKLQLGVITKNSKAFKEAQNAFENILASNPQYGPAYRELAETYYLWGATEPGKYEEYTEKAINYYKKYMELTDYSLDSRMRLADFLILTKDYEALEKEATEMQKMDKVNPRILRYLGYSAYENGNPGTAITAITKFLDISNGNKIIGRDYLYLGKAKILKALTSTQTDSTTIYSMHPTTLYESGIADIKKGVKMDPEMAGGLNEFAKNLFDKALYLEAASIYEIAVSNPNSKNFLYDNFYLGYALYYENVNKSDDTNLEALKKASTAFANVIAASPTTQDAYIYKARVNSLIQNDPVAQAEMSKNYEEYIRVVTEKGVVEMATPENKSKFIESYINLGLYYIHLDKIKARDYIEKALALDPDNETAGSTIKLLK